MSVERVTDFGRVMLSTLIFADDRISSRAL